MLLAGPTLSWWPLALLAVAPLVRAAARAERPWRDGLLAGFGAVPLWATWEWWVRDVSGLGFVPMTGILALFAGAFVALAAVVMRRLPRVPWAVSAGLTWAGLEFFRGTIACDGYAWGFASHPLIDAPWLAAPASIGGVYLVSTLHAMLSGALGRAWSGTGRRWGEVVVVGGLWVCACLGAWLAQPGTSETAVTVAVVQTNVPQDNKIGWTAEQERRDFVRFVELTRRAAALQPAFIVWPETMMPGITLERDALDVLMREGIVYRWADGEAPADAFARELAALQQEIGVPLLVGEEARVGQRVVTHADGSLDLPCDARYNSVYLLREGSVSPVRYDKIRLTPFGETMPYIRAWPWLQDKLLDLGARGMQFTLSAGTRRTVFEIPGQTTIRVVTPICFESTESALCRRLVWDRGQRRADLIVNVTNDGWFGTSRIGREQHLQIARWRSLELGTPTIRAANTGISAIIDPRGRVVASGVDGRPGAVDEDGVLSGSVPLGTGPTVYARLGDAAGWASLLGAASLLIAARFSRGASEPASDGERTSRVRPSRRADR